MIDVKSVFEAELVEVLDVVLVFNYKGKQHFTSDLVSLFTTKPRFSIRTIRSITSTKSSSLSNFVPYYVGNTLASAACALLGRGHVRHVVHTSLQVCNYSHFTINPYGKLSESLICQTCVYP